MHAKWLLCLSALILFGCGNNGLREPQTEVEGTIEETTEVHDDQVALESPNIDVPEIDPFFADVFDSAGYMESRNRLQVIGEEYLSLVEDDFERASNELIYYRSALSRENELSSWLLASNIEDTLSTSIIKKLELGELSLATAQSLIERYLERFYSVEGLAEAFDEELGIQLDHRFKAVETDILKNQIGIKQPRDATLPQRYAALFHHVSVITGGIDEQVTLDWAGNTHGIVVLTDLFDTHKNTVMASIYLEYLSGGGSPIDQNRQSLESFQEAISTKLSSTRLVEFSGLGFTKITPQDMTTFLLEI
ncbi:MAG: hypothetical protein AAGJ81_05290 [Verrucomicrobiota bacterium]